MATACRPLSGEYSLPSKEYSSDQNFILSQHSPQLELEPELEPELETVPDQQTDWEWIGSSPSRPRPREVSVLRKMISPVLGGLAAFPIATLIMWYGFGKDIGSTGPLVSQYVPWIVPQKLRSTRWEFTADDAPPSAQRQSPTLSRRTAPPQSTGRLPTLNRQPNSPADGEVEVPISATIAKLRSLRKSWNETPQSEHAKMVVEYFTTARLLSEQTFELKNSVVSVWRKEIDALAMEILTHPFLPRVLQIGAQGDLPGIPPPQIGDWVVTVLDVGINRPDPNATWILQETLTLGNIEMKVEILPKAWKLGAGSLPGKCFIQGKIVDRDSRPVLQVHTMVPERPAVPERLP